MPFPVGSRIAYDDRIFEVLQYLDDNHTVELGDIEQLQGLHGYKVIERLPVVLIENAELLQPNYTEGEVAQTVVQSVEDKGLNYHYQPEHRLYEGGPKAKFRNNVEAIRLLKQLQQENRIATTEEQIVLARFVGWGGLANGSGTGDRQLFLSPAGKYEPVKTLWSGTGTHCWRHCKEIISAGRHSYQRV